VIIVRIRIIGCRVQIVRKHVPKHFQIIWKTPRYKFFCLDPVAGRLQLNDDELPFLVGRI